MTSKLAQAMSRALEQTRSGNLAEATRTIQAGLGPLRTDAPLPGAAAIRAQTPDAEGIEQAASRPSRRPLREVIASLSKVGRVKSPRGAVPVPAGARYERRRFAGPAGSRDYTLYVPAEMPDGPQGLVLMLHGCTQDADDFARGTGMNGIADQHGLIVTYPEQPRSENPQGCWNWFRPGDQRSGTGEPEILAGLARALAAEFAVPPGRVFAAGLSAGGAAAAILAVTHPELFGAVGVHSGLPHGAARDVPSAFAAMHGSAGAGTAPRLDVPVIVFHGTADPTVHPSNGDRLYGSAAGDVSRERVTVEGGRSCRVTAAFDGEGRPRAELWSIAGAGHAWSGGSSDGSYSDPAGPSASAEMVRFFLSVTA